MKVVGPLHKTDVGGVALNIIDYRKALKEFKRMMKIKNAKGVLDSTYAFRYRIVCWR